MSRAATTVEAYPLQWPAGRPRTKHRQRANFGKQTKTVRQWSDGSQSTYTGKRAVTAYESIRSLREEARRLGASGLVISSNLRLKIDGDPYSNQREPDDPGVAVYFQLAGKPHTLACDKWDRAADNLRAISKFVEAMRGQDRWGVASAAEIFAGFKALPGDGEAIVTPAPMTVEDAASFVASAAGEQWRASPGGSRQALDGMYRAAAKRLHPDANGGVTTPDWHRLQQAKDLLDRHHEPAKDAAK